MTPLLHTETMILAIMAVAPTVNTGIVLRAR